jgi:spermidine synthase
MNRSTRLLAAVCFFSSGAAGLIYEVLWSRHLRLVFGSTTYSVSVVLATFMAGLGLGGHLFGRIADRTRSPLRLYGLLEVGVGLYALATGPLLAVARGVYGGVASRVELGAGAATGLKLALSAIVLLPPATLMGGTLPALLRAVSDSTERGRRLVGLLYGLNTLGAVAGTLATGLVFLEALGLSTTMRVAAVANLGIGALVIARSLRLPAPPSTGGERSPVLENLRVLAASRVGRYALLGLFVSGATAMLYEIAFTRMLALVFGVSSYAFSIVLGVYLAGLALGGLAYAGLQRLRAPRASDFGWVQLVLAIAGALLMLLLPTVPRLVFYARQIPQLTFWEMLTVKATVAGGLILPFALIAGLGVPLLIAVLAGQLDRLGRVVGDAYMVNTAGTLVGSLLTGFFLISSLGTEGTLRLAVAVNAAVGALGLLFLPSLRGRAAGVLVGSTACALAVAVPRWPIELYTVSDTSRHAKLAQKRIDLEQRLHGLWRDRLFFEEGREATIAAFAGSHGRVLIVNAHADASDGADMSTQLFAGIVPMAVHPRPEDVLIVGFGSGVTADVVNRTPETKRIDVLELEDAVIRAAPSFAHVNHGVERAPKVRIIVDDARPYAAATPRRYDVIVSEPSNPWRAGVASLFTTDFYRAARRVLKPGGMFAQWVQLYALDVRSLQMILRTMAASFPEVDVWWLDSGNVIVLGREQALPLDVTRVQSLIGPGGPFAVDAARYWSLADPSMFYAHFLLDTDGVRRFLEDAPEILNSDDLPLLEFEAPRAIFGGEAENDERLLAAKLRLDKIVPPVAGGPPPEPSWVWAGIARMHLEAQLKEAAVVAGVRAVDLAPTPQPNALRLEAAAIALSGDQPAEAERQLSAIAALEPELARRADLVRGRLRVAEGRLAEALDAFSDADDGAASVATYERLLVAVKLGRTAEALHLARRVLEAARPGGELGATHVDRVYLELTKLGDHAGADAVARELPSDHGAFSELLRARTRAVILDDLGDARAALEQINFINRVGALDDDVLEIEARARRAVGDIRGARRVERLLRWLAPDAFNEDVISPLTGR